MKKHFFYQVSFTILLLIYAGFELKAQIIINEFSASNSGSVTDPDFKGSSDWIEIYNKGSLPVNLNGYFLSDNLTIPNKWMIDSSLVIQPESFVVLWCDGRDTMLHTNFKLAAEGETIVLSGPEGNLIDSVSYILQETNISQGRVCDGCRDWVYFLESSPGKSNTGLNYSGLVKTKPYFFPLGGIFKNAISVELKNLFKGEIRYTLDGSEPTLASAVYQYPLIIDKHTVVRARIFEEITMKPGAIVTNTYFINQDNQLGKLPVVSIASNPDNFWDPEKGIYVQSFKPDWEIPINIELFENDGSDRAGFNLQAGTKINGLYSWQLPQKMLGIYFRKEYGAGSLDYPLFDNMKARKYDSFALRASGSDWAYTLFRDGMAQQSTKINMSNETQGFRPCVVFINGQYMGIHNIRSKVDADFIINENLAEGTKIDMIENENYVEEGNINEYAAFEKEYKADLSNPLNYEIIASKMDIENYMDFMIFEIYGINTSVGHNVMTWKPKDFGKWRWIMVDMDRCFFDPLEQNTAYFLGKTNYPLSYLMTNASFKKKMGYRLADQVYTTFNPQRMHRFINTFADNIREELPKHIERWKGTSSSYGNPIPSIPYWEGSISEMKTFISQRNSILLDDWKNYGLGARVNLTLNAYPAGTGKILLNGLSVPQDITTGYYPAASNINLKATALPGYKFSGWKVMTDTILISKEDNWKYYDKGNILSEEWIKTNYPDESWSEGIGELGYGDGDEETVISYGGSSSNKYPTAYFRKKININNANLLTSYRISLKVDDGAVIYINGKEFDRINMRFGEKVNYNTLAEKSIPSEKALIELALDPGLLQSGENTIAVEVHQNALNSSDLSFEMQLTASLTNTNILTNQDTLNLPVNANLSVAAIFEDLGFCTLPAEINVNTTLFKSCSPYISNGNVLVKEGATLTVEPGVEIRMAQNASLTINGNININGTEKNPVLIHSNKQAGASQWGALILSSTTDTCRLDYMTLEDGTNGVKPWTQTAVLSIFKSIVRMDHITIINTKSNPIIARNSDITLKNSNLRSFVTGDLINVKYGKSIIENCTFEGNNSIDTDAIDYDDVNNGIIADCLIHDFYGSNSDAIDIGENAKNIQISNVVIYNISDKGLSVGQQSSATLTNSLIINCNQGVTAKDSSHVMINQCTFYACNTPVVCYEKNIGSAGGNTLVSNSILSNAYLNSISADEKSYLKVINSIADNDTLPVADGNIYADPMFESVLNNNFTYKDGSPALNTNNGKIIGATVRNLRNLPVTPLITAFYPGNSTSDDIEFIMLENPANESYNLSGSIFYEGIDYVFPENTSLESGEKIIITNNAAHAFWQNKTSYRIMQWNSGRLNNDGEIIGFSNKYGIITDNIRFEPKQPWPYRSNNSGVIKLIDKQLDNHFGKNWEDVSIEKFFSITGLENTSSNIQIYPNPANLKLFIRCENKCTIEILNNQGQRILHSEMNSGINEIQLDKLIKGIYLVRTENFSEKLIIK